MPARKALPRIRLFNTLTRRKEIFRPMKSGEARMYTCGPTVYDYAHIGNLRTYIFEDLLKRVLEHAGYRVLHVMNITDVGHLVSDADTGEDKMEIGARREKKNVWEISDFYTKTFFSDMEKLHIERPSIVCKATDHIGEMTGIIAALEKKGYTYLISDGVYFDTSRLKDYGKLARLKKETLKAGARIEMVPGKRNPTDFALWKFSPAGAKRQMEWQSPWGTGFPGWHVECSAMSMKYLGRTFDIHCGGVDHIAVHHTNEIAQSEAATGKKFVNVWLHGEFMLVEGRKMAKSMGNYYRLQDLTDRGSDPLAFRYLCISSHYRSQLNFTFAALKHAEKTLENINDFFSRVEAEIEKTGRAGKLPAALKKNAAKMESCLLDDLNTPQTLSQLFSIMRATNRMMDRKEAGRTSLEFVRRCMLDMDSIFQFLKPRKELSGAERKLVDEREEARKKGDYRKADDIRERLRKMGVLIEDTEHGPVCKKVGKPE